MYTREKDLPALNGRGRRGQAYASLRSQSSVSTHDLHSQRNALTHARAMFFYCLGHVFNMPPKKLETFTNRTRTFPAV